MKVLVSGSIAYDKIMNFPGYFKDHILPDKIHNINVSFFIDKVSENFGGTAGNIAYNLALLGEDPVIFSTAGHDFEKYRKWLEKHDIDLSRMRIVEDAGTALATMMTDKADNQIASFCPGAMMNPCPMEYSDEFSDSIAIVAPGLMQDMVTFSEFYAKHDIPFIFDPGQAITSLSGDDLKKCIKAAKYFISNDYELNVILKRTNFTEKDILDSVDILVTTLGEKGSVAKTKKRTYEIKPAKPKAVVDPTGAGDAYRAGFIKGLLNGWPIDTTCEFAGVISCYAVENYGTQNHKYDFEEAKKRYEINFNKKIN
ncbi:MAG: carbohydrate kinase family protein [Candidatus Paceibacterota bacterium]|jgi:adenosine kinase